jgi:DNA-binding NtrC family response regulator
MAHILLVEDEPDTRYALAQVLSSAGHDIVEADSADDAAELLAQKDVDLLVCELQLSHGQAPGILDEVRKRNPTLDVIAICGGGLAGSARHVEAARAAGVAAVLHKPFDSETLVAVAEHLLNGGRRTRAAGVHAPA